ncbi:acyl-CoA carboxylase subunit epsilon [Microbacterium sp. 179-B 1A2 NHS]|uniref:acyl-CoA carboxylase subunit epsilon n=1 Tax=Microbacterium sp. 179-B 1A2 NHS TaxID=3142383 RepID=UPI00399F52D3
MTGGGEDIVGALRVDVHRGDPTEEELAAVIAVVTESYVREASTAIAEDASVSPWAVSARGPRAPLRRDVPWGRFAG